MLRRQVLFLSCQAGGSLINTTTYETAGQVRPQCKMQAGVNRKCLKLEIGLNSAQSLHYPFCKEKSDLSLEAFTSSRIFNFFLSQRLAFNKNFAKQTKHDTNEGNKKYQQKFTYR